MSKVERASTALPTLRNLLESVSVDAATSVVKRRDAGAVESSTERDDELVSVKPTLLQRLQHVLSLYIERVSSDNIPPLGSNLDDDTLIRESRQLSTGEMLALRSLIASGDTEAG